VSLLLAGLVLGLSLLCAWAVWHFGRKYDEPGRKIRLLTAMFVLGGLAAAWFAYQVDSEQRRTTLFETVIEGTTDAQTVDGTAVNRFALQVEHAGVAHDLLVAPKPGSGRNAAGPVTLRIRWVAPDDRAVLDETHEFEVREESVGTRLPSVRRRIWDSQTWRIEPATTGAYALEIWHLTQGIPQILVRVADPLKTDGERAPGY